MITPKAGWGQDVTRNSDLLAGSSHTHVSLGRHQSEGAEACLGSAMHDAQAASVTDLCQGNPNAG
jgi:hypothetical protein